jgi:hypothetical protein
MPIPGFVPIKRKPVILTRDLQGVGMLNMTRFQKIDPDQRRDMIRAAVERISDKSYPRH